MSSTTTKNLILSQPKCGTTETNPVPVLTNEVHHNESSTVVYIEIPGVDPSTVDVSCENNFLQVKCEKGEFIHAVDPTVDTSKIKAEIQWGLLTVTIPAPVTPVSRSIKVNIHDAVKSTKPKFTAEE